jgi:hypothetical protein
MFTVLSSQIQNEPISHSACSSHSPTYLGIKGKSLGVFEFSKPAIDGNYNNTNTRNGGCEVSMVVTKNYCLLGSNIALYCTCAQIFKKPENCTLLGYYTLSRGSFFMDSRTLWMTVIGCPKTSVRNYH